MSKSQEVSPVLCAHFMIICYIKSVPCALTQIATDYGSDASLTSLLNTMDIYMLIVANPDGYVFSHTKVSLHCT